MPLPFLPLLIAPLVFLAAKRAADPHDDQAYGAIQAATRAAREADLSPLITTALQAGAFSATPTSRKSGRTPRPPPAPTRKPAPCFLLDCTAR